MRSEIRTSPERLNSAQILWRYPMGYWPAIVAGVVCAMVAAILQLSGPWILRRAIDNIRDDLAPEKIALYPLLMILIATSVGVLRFVMRRFLVGASREIEYQIRNDFFAHIQRLSPDNSFAQRPGDLLSRATSDLAAVRMMLGPAVVHALTTVVLFAVTLGIRATYPSRRRTSKRDAYLTASIG